MFLTIGIILIILWVLGFITFNVVGSYIHILLVLAIIMILIRVIKGK